MVDHRHQGGQGGRHDVEDGLAALQLGACLQLPSDVAHHHREGFDLVLVIAVHDEHLADRDSRVRRQPSTEVSPTQMPRAMAVGMI